MCYPRGNSSVTDEFSLVHQYVCLEASYICAQLLVSSHKSHSCSPSTTQTFPHKPHTLMLHLLRQTRFFRVFRPSHKDAASSFPDQRSFQRQRWMVLALLPKPPDGVKTCVSNRSLQSMTKRSLSLTDTSH